MANEKDAYVYNMYAKVTSITASKPGFVLITIQLDSTGVGNLVLELPVGSYHLKNFIPGEALRILIERD